MDDGDDVSWKRPADLMGPSSGGVDLKHASSQVIVERLLELCNMSGSVAAQSPGGRAYSGPYSLLLVERHFLVEPRPASQHGSTSATDDVQQGGDQ